MTQTRRPLLAECPIPTKSTHYPYLSFGQHLVSTAEEPHFGPIPTLILVANSWEECFLILGDMLL
jgi:hypothetical protein